MTEQNLQRLFDQLEQKQQQRLDQIEQQRADRAVQTADQLRHAFEASVEKLQQDHARLLKQKNTRFQRAEQLHQQQRIWRCQRTCLQEIVSDTRTRLAQEPQDQEVLAGWLDAVRRQMGQVGQVTLKLRPESIALVDLADLEQTGINIIPAPLLGGAVWVDERQQIEVDGSWERRLEDLIPLLWARWLKDVGADYPH